jgi:hypothetical protein
VGAIETLLAKLGATQNPGYLVAQGVNKITTPGYPADDALRGYVAGAPAFQPTIGGMLKQTGTDLASAGTGFLKSLMAGDYEAAMNNSLFPLGGMTVFHGSPHRFDAFDMSKIGTGEGAQAYGHGLYFAESPDVAKQYVMAGRNIGFDNRDGVPQYMAKSLAMTGGDAKAAIGILTDALSKTKGETKAANLKLAIKQLSEGKGEFGLYHVDIPDDDIAKMLDWDKPLSEQAESVKSLLRGSDIAPDESVWSQYTGQQLYEGEMQAGGPYKGSGWASSEAQKAVSEKLRKIGIPGIKYLDHGSRFSSGGELLGVWQGEQKVMADTGSGKFFARISKKVGDDSGFTTSPPMDTAEAAKAWAEDKIASGTRNLVIFDDKLAKVIKRE